MMDKYQLLEVIGEGSFGRVWKAEVKAKEKEDRRRLVALKFVQKINQSEADLQAIRKEWSILKTLNHENIVTAIEAFETKIEAPSLVLVTEFVDGGNLSVLMSQYPKGLDSEKVKNLTIDLLCALHFLHRQRILHRDLKAQNVLIEKASGKAKLADFGFARNMSDNTMVLTSIKGTPLYMAPELIEEKPYDFKADLWSAGCILYEASFGKPPFQTNSLFALIKMIRNDKVHWPTDGQNKPEVALLKGILEKDPKRRLNWPDLLQHSYLNDHPKIKECSRAEMEFTRELTESQELAKEMQRQDKAKKLPGGGQTLVGIAQKYEEQKKKQQSIAQKYEEQKKQKARRFSDLTHYQTLVRPEPVRRRNSDFASYVHEEKDEEPFNNDEWLQFLDQQMKAMDTEGKINSNDLLLLMKPLKSSLASNEVVKKTIIVLALPFSKAVSVNPLCDAYINARVIEHLVNKLKHFSAESEDDDCLEVILLLLTKLCYLDQKKIIVTKIESGLIVPFLEHSNPQIVTYTLDILIQIARTNPFDLDSGVDLTKNFQSQPKKTLILMCLLPNKRHEAKLLIQNNQPFQSNDEKLDILCDKLLSL